MESNVEMKTGPGENGADTGLTRGSAEGTGTLSGALAEALYEKSLDCVHCGLCLTSCPTYRETGRETASPRGRIYLMRGLAEGRLEEAETLAEEAFLCLGCRACETACPSGVQYGEMLEQTRSAVRSAQGFELAAWIERLALREIVPKPARLRVLVGLLALAQRTGLDRFVARLMPARLREMHALLPEIPSSAERQRMPAFTPAVVAEGSAPRGRVALLEGCVMPEFFGRVNDAARKVLSRAGYDVLVPPTQGCCGALQAHSGDLETARALARKNVGAFEAGDDSGGDPSAAAFDAIIVTSAGCSAALREVESWIGESGRGLARGVRDVLEFLDEIGPEIDFAPIAKRLCYDDPCHLIHAQGISEAPRRLLSAIPELELVAHRDPAACCGAAGIYNLTQPEMSASILSPKLESLLEADPEWIATANPGCAMQLAAGLARAGHPLPILHPIELLEQASRGHLSRNID